MRAAGKLIRAAQADEVYRTAGAWVKDGEIGKVQQFEVRVVNHVDENSKWYKTPWRTVPDVSDAV